jgi:hypothetical protein
MRFPVSLLLVTLSWTAWATGINQGPPVDKNLFVPVLTKTMVEGQIMTVNEVIAMEPACLVIGMGRATGNHWGMPDGTFPKGAGPQMSNYPMLYIEGTSINAGWFHHYCWGELSRVRYLTATNTNKRAKYLNKWIGAIHYSLREAKSKNNRWSYLNKVRGDLAAAQLESKKYALAAVTAAEVIAVAPEIEATHITLIDALIALKKRPEAEAATLEALKLFGKKKSLVRRYKALTGREPDIPDPEPAPVAASEMPAPVPSESPVPQQGGLTKDAALESAPVVQESVSPPASIGNETNPYCRFCPDPPATKP